MPIRGAWARPLLLLVFASACELKENAQPPGTIAGAEQVLPTRDTVRLVDTVTLTRIETVFVVDTFYDAMPARSAGATKTATRTPTKITSKASLAAAAPVSTKKPIAVTRAPVDTRTLPATPTTKSGNTKTTTATAAAVSRADLDYLRSRKLLLPVSGIPLSRMPDNFLEKRGTRQHAALDFMAPKGTPVLSTDAGVIAKVHTSVGGGLTLYAADPRGEFIYYYAHLDRYKAGLKEGDRIAAGDVLGYVGSTGNATPGAPHLHFAIGKMDGEKRWWKTTAIDPKPLIQRVIPAR